MDPCPARRARIGRPLPTFFATRRERYSAPTTARTPHRRRCDAFDHPFMRRRRRADGRATYRRRRREWETRQFTLYARSLAQPLRRPRKEGDHAPLKVPNLLQVLSRDICVLGKRDNLFWTLKRTRMNNETPLFQNGPFFKIGHAGGKELRWLVRYIAVAAKWIFRLRESFIPRTDPNRTRKAGRKEEGREGDGTEYLFTRMERESEGGGSGYTGSRYGIEWRGCKGSLAWKNSPPSVGGCDPPGSDCARSDLKI